jgi:hypothetical protein
MKGAMKSKKPWLLFVLLLILSYYTPCFSIAGDTLSAGHSLSYSKSETILSRGSNFELGFFKPGTSSNIYLGIWYKKFDEKDIVWVANRENPLSHPSSSTLLLSQDGNLLLFQGSSKLPFWSTNLTHPLSNSTEAVLRDDGNFVLRDISNASCIFWESFDHPTDTWLPGAKLGIDKVTGKPQQLISWKNSQDPAPGLFSLGLDPNGSNQYFLKWNRSQIYWSSGLWNGTSFSFANVPEISRNSHFNFNFVSNENGRYFTCSIVDPSSFRSKFVMKYTGEITQNVWLSGPWQWTLYWHYPKKLCDIYAFCGAFGVYHENSSSPCECLTGFEPYSVNYTRLNDWSDGCVRKSHLQYENNTYADGNKDWFLIISNVQLPDYSKPYPSVISALNCEVACINDSSCTAYAYNRNGCMIWEGALWNLQQLSDGGEVGQNIYLKLAANEHQNTKGKKKRKIYTNLCHLLF